jgi:hypothetical protein
VWDSGSQSDDAGQVAVGVKCGKNPACPDTIRDLLKTMPDLLTKDQISMLPAICCADESTSTCGRMAVGSDLCTPVAPPDIRCESALGGRAVLPGCCASGNQCGLVEPGSGMCYGISIFEVSAQMQGQMLPANFPKARACDAADTGDSGTEDGGV